MIDDDDENNVTTIHDCYCPNCKGSHAETRLMPMTVPGFREIILMALNCPDCHFRNSEVTFGGSIQAMGSILEFDVETKHDWNRQVVKGDFATLRFPKLNLEIPPSTQRGVLTTVEGILTKTREQLLALQPERVRLGDIDNFRRCQKVIDQIDELIGNEEEAAKEEEAAPDRSIHLPFTMILDDPSGNSVIENPLAPHADPQLTITRYQRSPTQDLSVGLQPSKESKQSGYVDDSNPEHKEASNISSTQRIEWNKDTKSSGVGRDEPLRFPTSCPSCKEPSEVAMCTTYIPHFKESIIMSMFCETCGYRTNEIKGGGPIPERGTRVTVEVQEQEDLSREVLKSASSGIRIPELDFELEEGGLDGVYTTVEGLLKKMVERLQLANPLSSGDSTTKQHLYNDGQAFSTPTSFNTRYQSFLQALRAFAEGEVLPFTVIITDPLSNSFVSPRRGDRLELEMQAKRDGSMLCYDEFVDPCLVVETFERTKDQNERLGICDMKVEGYNHTLLSYGTDQFSPTARHQAATETRRLGIDHPRPIDPPGCQR